jgi:hypothetical protein
VSSNAREYSVTTRNPHLNEWTVLADHVAPFSDSTGYRSTFNAALREARLLTCRNLKTGSITDEKTETLWAGTVIYLVLLEQVGKSLRPHGSKVIKNEKPIETALRMFGPNRVTKRQRQVLYALRCAFAHEFGLYNENRRQPFYQHVFRLDDTPGHPLVTWPGRRWSGDYADASNACSTTVGLITVGDVAEHTVRKVREHSNKTTLRSRIALEELQKRFGFVIYP